MQTVSSIKSKKMMLWIIIVSAILLILLIVRLAVIQFVDGNKLKQLAYEQQTLNRKITSKRGTIYDATGENILAQSSTVETVTVNSTNIPEDKKELVSKALSDILELDYEETLKKVQKRSSIETIAKKVEEDKITTLKTWMKENDISSGINIDSDTKRYYPYDTFASRVLGFTGGDNQGIIGLEVKYEEVLKGTDGTILTVTDARGVELEKVAEDRIEPVAGNTLQISLDHNIQKYCEQAAKKVQEEKQADSVSVLLMNPQDGEIFAMVNTPEFNLNTPFELIDVDENTEQTDEQTQEMLNQMWRNPCINDTYEPGSTFKIITASACLEEGVVSLSDTFSCPGYRIVEDRKIRCHKVGGHGQETFIQGIQNSCNPVFIDIGLRLGAEKFYAYFKQFGLLSLTNIDLPGEAGTIMHNVEDIGLVELATISFGQSFQVTPVQMATTVSSLVNGGYRVTPHFGVAVLEKDGTEIRKLKYKKKNGIVSEKTSETMRILLKSVVEEGSGKNGYIEGYSIGGKTETSQTLPRSANKYISSFIGFAPAEDPQVLGIVVIRNPQGIYYGGTIAAPVLRSIYDNVLPYLGIEKN